MLKSKRKFTLGIGLLVSTFILTSTFVVTNATTHQTIQGNKKVSKIEHNINTSNRSKEALADKSNNGLKTE
ncbi:hypothetical protein, partial [Clostridium haemolyticum]